MTHRSTDRAAFTIERTFAHPPSRVFAAFTSQAAKSGWFVDPDADWTSTYDEFDFRVGGHERMTSRGQDGTTVVFAVHYLDIVEDERVIYSYEMEVGGQRISASLASIELAATPTGVGTRLTLTEHGLYLDGLDNSIDRERGTNELIDNLGAWLDAATEPVH